LVILALFVVLVVGMFRMLTAAETQWTRAVFLFSGVEAIAFAAAGYLFGREVNRQRAEAAEDSSKKLSEKATEAVAKSAEATANGQALTSMIDSKLEAASALGAIPGGQGQPELAELASVAHKLFP
jgi:ATP-dependent protease HslVU (ClpYQ) ATPase subunit